MIYAYLRVSTDDQDTANQRQHMSLQLSEIGLFSNSHIDC